MRFSDLTNSKQLPEEELLLPNKHQGQLSVFPKRDVKQ